MSPELDSILRMYDYMESECWVHLRVRHSPPSSALLPGLPYVMTGLPLHCTRQPSHATEHPPCRSFGGVDAPSSLPGANPPFRCVQQLWFVPTLLRNSRFQHHPWVRCAGRRNRRCASRGMLCPATATTTVLSPAECCKLAIPP